MDGSKVLVVV